MKKIFVKSELKYILIAGIFSFVYFIYLLPLLLRYGFENQAPLIQFVLFSIGIYFIYFFVFRSFALNKKVSLILVISYSAFFNLIYICSSDSVFLYLKRSSNTYRFLTFINKNTASGKLKYTFNAP